jgi:hypothetical protein
MELTSQSVTGGHTVEVIEDLPPSIDRHFSVDLPVSSARLVPQGEAVPVVKKDGRHHFTVPRFACHQMVELQTG